MKTRCFLILLIALALCPFCGVAARERGPSTPEERAKVIEFTRSLETDPLAGDAREKRQWLSEWIIEVPDVSVKFCADLIDPALGKKYAYSAEVGLHPLFAAAVFAIQHPEESGDDGAMYLAGLEGALRVYEVLVKSKPGAKLAAMDDLLAKRDSGALPGYVEKLAQKKCKS